MSGQHTNSTEKEKILQRKVKLLWKYHVQRYLAINALLRDRVLGNVAASYTAAYHAPLQALKEVIKLTKMQRLRSLDNLLLLANTAKCDKTRRAFRRQYDTMLARKMKSTLLG